MDAGLSRLTPALEELKKQLEGEEDLVAEDEATLRMLQMVIKVAGMDTTVLLEGETGVGKERIATFIYQHSRRCNQQLIKVNCGAIPVNLLESELFGYERGSFTGANKEGKSGLFEAADNGTIFLDEIGELPMEMQVKLLRVLQEQEVERIGAVKPVKINVRVLAATNRNLEEMLIERTFRPDLYYRLNVFPILIPPLRQRPGDILPLAQKMLDSLNRKYNFQKVFAPSACSELERYSWPGNVRELKNSIERAAIMSNGAEIAARDLPFQLGELDSRKAEKQMDGGVNLKELLERIEMDYIERAYAKCKNVRAAAKWLHMDAATYVRKRRKYAEKYPALLEL